MYATISPKGRLLLSVKGNIKYSNWIVSGSLLPSDCQKLLTKSSVNRCELRVIRGKCSKNQRNQQWKQHRWSRKISNQSLFIMHQNPVFLLVYHSLVSASFATKRCYQLYINIIQLERKKERKSRINWLSI